LTFSTLGLEGVLAQLDTSPAPHPERPLNISQELLLSALDLYRGVSQLGMPWRPIINGTKQSWKPLCVDPAHRLPMACTFIACFCNVAGILLIK
jgi:hypothetical protein